MSVVYVRFCTYERRRLVRGFVKAQLIILCISPGIETWSNAFSKSIKATVMYCLFL